LAVPPEMRTMRRLRERVLSFVARAVQCQTPAS